MDTQFISLFLLVFVINIIGLYIYQQNNKSVNNELNNELNNSGEEAMYIHSILNNNANHNTNNNVVSSCHLDIEAARVLGPVHNFHQKFNKQLYNLDTKYQQKNADPLGWRKRYLIKNNKFLVPTDKNFDNISTKNFLNNLENVDNIYRKGCSN